MKDLKMSNQCKLYYDATCPICDNYVKLLKRKINASEIQFIGSTEKMDDFKFSLEDGSTYYGKEATERLAKRFPVVLDYFWMLPEKYKAKGLQAAYAVGSAARTVIKKVTGCGCGK